MVEYDSFHLYESSNFKNEAIFLVRRVLKRGLKLFEEENKLYSTVVGLKTSILSFYRFAYF